jgi:hypothetical protein
MEEGEEDDHEGPGPITSRRPWQPGTSMSKISRTVQGGKEVARNFRKGCRTLDEERGMNWNGNILSCWWFSYGTTAHVEPCPPLY